MIEQLNIPSIVDVGFVALVTLACLRSLMRDSGGIERQREQWRAELKNLEQSLRGLISEAGAESSRLDRSLLQRKRELEQLLKKIEARTHDPASSGRPETPRAVRKEPLLDGDDLPNDSWREQTRSGPEQRAGNRPSGRYRQGGNQEFVLGGELEQLVEAAEDTVAITDEIGRRSASAAARPRSAEPPKRSLSQEIEVMQTEPVTQDEMYNRTSILDPTTFKIAKRLLMEGKEIHVVARKLDLPVAEVRGLERMIRHEAAGTRLPFEDEQPTLPLSAPAVPEPERAEESRQARATAPRPTPRTAYRPAAPAQTAASEQRQYAVQRESALL